MTKRGRQSKGQMKEERKEIKNMVPVQKYCGSTKRTLTKHSKKFFKEHSLEYHILNRIFINHSYILTQF